MKKAKLLIPLCLLLLGGCSLNNNPQSETPSESSTPAESSSAETSSSEPSSEVPSSSEQPSSEVPSSSEEPEPSSQEPEPSSEEPGPSSEEPTPIEEGWYIVGEGSFVNGDTWSPAGGILMTVNSSYEGQGTEYMALDVKFNAKDTWKLCNTNNEWISNGWETESGAIFAGDMELIDDGFGGNNVGVVVTSTYDIYFKDYENGTYSCWISEAKTASPVDPSEPSEPVDPSEPSEPSEPVDPSEPEDPIVPSEPSEPSEPEDPIPGEETFEAIFDNFLNTTNATVDYYGRAEYDGQTQERAVTYFLNENKVGVSMNGQSMVQEGQYPLGYLITDFCFAGSYKLGEISDKGDGTISIDKITVYLSAEKYIKFNGRPDANYNFKNDGFALELTNIDIILEQGKIAFFSYTGNSLGVSGSSSDGTNWSYEFKVNTEIVVKNIYTIFDYGTTVIPDSSGTTPDVEPDQEEATMDEIYAAFEKTLFATNGSVETKMSATFQGQYAEMYLGGKTDGKHIVSIGPWGEEIYNKADVHVGGVIDDLDYIGKYVLNGEVTFKDGVYYCDSMSLFASAELVAKYRHGDEIEDMVVECENDNFEIIVKNVEFTLKDGLLATLSYDNDMFLQSQSSTSSDSNIVTVEFALEPEDYTTHYEHVFYDIGNTVIEVEDDEGNDNSDAYPPVDDGSKEDPVPTDPKEEEIPGTDGDKGEENDGVEENPDGNKE